ncbi:hypothetical protein A4X09_0g7094 [Tilletia walkeri]|uniref:Uncharacterized protein n=1 Tax=Tilletia walkeri TaxID=117179 RepID=A0A8X7N2S8_9BASI|nr:hypothetical protein A4X09_0g7094 [Tilletia walkeri]
MRCLNQTTNEMAPVSKALTSRPLQSPAEEPIEPYLHRRLRAAIDSLLRNPLTTREDTRSAQQQAVLVSALVECQYGIASGSKRLGAGSDCNEDGVARDGRSRIALAIPNLKELPCLVGPLSKLDLPSTELSGSTWDLLVQCFHERGTGSVEKAEAYRTEVLDLATGLQRRDWPPTAVKTFVQVGLEMKDAPDERRVLRRKSLEESKLAPPPNVVILGMFAMSTDHLWERVTGGSTCFTGEVAAHLASAYSSWSTRTSRCLQEDSTGHTRVPSSANQSTPSALLSRLRSKPQ